MLTSRRSARSVFLSTVLLVFVALPGILTWKQYDQQRLDNALIVAVKNNNAPSVVALLDQGANPNARDTMAPPSSFWHYFLIVFHRKPANDLNTPTAFLLASTKKDTNFGIIQALVESGARISGKDGYGEPPLIHAVMKEDIRTVELYLRHHVDVNESGKNGWTPLSVASDCRDDTTIMRLLIAHGAHLENKSHPPLLEALAYDSFRNSEAARVLVKAGANIEVRDTFGRTPLFHAVSWGKDASATNLLLDCGANLESRDAYGQTPLIAAASFDNEGKEACLRTLLARKANVKARDREGDSALDVARIQGNTGAVRLLFQAGDRSKSR